MRGEEVRNRLKRMDLQQGRGRVGQRGERESVVWLARKVEKFEAGKTGVFTAAPCSQW